jgi:hypothetical protein
MSLSIFGGMVEAAKYTRLPTPSAKSTLATAVRIMVRVLAQRFGFGFPLAGVV